MTSTLVKKEIKSLIRESVKEALGAELMKLRATLFSFVSESEQKDIERRYKKPTRKVAKSYAIEL